MPDPWDPTALEDRCAPNLGSYFNDCFESPSESLASVFEPSGVDSCEQQPSQISSGGITRSLHKCLSIPSEEPICPSVAGGGLCLAVNHTVLDSRDLHCDGNIEKRQWQSRVETAENRNSVMLHGNLLWLVLSAATQTFTVVFWKETVRWERHLSSLTSQVIPPVVVKQYYDRISITCFSVSSRFWGCNKTIHVRIRADCSYLFTPFLFPQARWFSPSEL